LFGEEAPKYIRFNFEKVYFARGTAAGERGGSAMITLNLDEIEILARYFLSKDERYYIRFIRLFSHEIVHTLGASNRRVEFREEEAFANLVSSVYILNKFEPYKCIEILIEEFLRHYEWASAREGLSVHDFYSLGVLAGLGLLNLKPKERLEIAKRAAELLEKYKDPIKFDEFLLEYAKKALEIEIESDVKEKIKHFLERFEKKIKEREAELSKELFLLILIASLSFIFFVTLNRATGFFTLEGRFNYTTLLVLLTITIVFIGLFFKKFVRKLKSFFDQSILFKLFRYLK